MTSPYINRRHLVSFASRRLPHIFTDVLVIGAGAAGLRAAIAAGELGQVIVLAKGKAFESNTYHAQGGLAAVIDPVDDVASHVDDTLKTGLGLCDEQVVRQCINASPEHIAQLRRWGMAFDTEPDGGGGGEKLQLGREGGHSANRIVHAAGDATGRVLEETLLAKAQTMADVKIFEECFALDLLTEPAPGGPGARCIGALTYHPRFGMQIIRARRVILASGGAGMLWRETSNPAVATADGIALAFRAGAKLADLELMQFHPTTLYVAGASRALISEAVRGEGAHLLDRDGERFMASYHEMAELAPRDVVSQAILDRIVKTGANKVFLDVRHIGAERFAKRFPFIDSQCRAFDIDPGRDLIPVHPAAHYMIGGVAVDAAGQTSLPGLWACGEAACTGLHGANRLASNSLAEAMVFGQRAGQLAGESLARSDDKFDSGQIDWTVERSTRTELDLADIRNSLRAMMWRNVGIVRDGQHLGESIEIIDFWGRYVLDKEFFNDPRGWEVQNMLTAAWLVAELAKRRTESRGVHFRSDHPKTNPAWCRHQTLRRGENELIVE